MSESRNNNSGISTFSEFLTFIPRWMKWTSIILVFLTLVPVITYIKHFWRHPYSNDPGDWGTFGDYVGGTLNPLLAITGIFVTFCLAYIARETDKAKVRPLARIALADYDNVIEVKIENAGLGPMIIESINVMNQNGEIKKSLIAWFQNDKYGFIVWDEYVGDAKDFIISPSNELVLLKITKNPQTNRDNLYYRDEIRKELSKLIISVKYKDLYNNPLMPQTRTLEWFGREIFFEKRR